jgi:GntR family carbon starvation induced transcriptional regulator
MAESAPETRGDWALRRLRSAILTGEFPPGTKLRAEELAERWQVSPTPLREAFQRLGGAGLVEVSPQRGVRVAEFTLEDAADLYALRLRLEPAALRHSLRKSDDAHRREIADAFARLAAARTLDAGAEAHLAFHAALLARCPSAWTRHIVAELAEHAQRYALLGAQRYRDSDPRREHRALHDAALAGQVDAATALLTKHLRGTLDSVRAAMAAAPDVSPRPNATASRRRRSQEQPR